MSSKNPKKFHLKDQGLYSLDMSVACVIIRGMALSKNPVIYHRGERRARRVLRLFQPLLRFSGAFAFSVCSAVKFKDLAISLENSTVPRGINVLKLLLRKWGLS